MKCHLMTTTDER